MPLFNKSGYRNVGSKLINDGSNVISSSAKHGMHCDASASFKPVAVELAIHLQMASKVDPCVKTAFAGI